MQTKHTDTNLFFSVSFCRGAEAEGAEGAEAQRVRRLRLAAHPHEAGGARSGPGAAVRRLRPGRLDDRRGDGSEQSGRAVRGLDAVGVSKNGATDGGAWLHFRCFGFVCCQLAHC